MEKIKRKKAKNVIKSTIKYIFVTLGSLLAVIVAAFFFMLYGPFHELRDLYVISMLETSAAKFMATAFFSDETINEILANNRLEVVDEPTDPSLISIAVTTTAKTEPPQTTGSQSSAPAATEASSGSQTSSGTEATTPATEGTTATTKATTVTTVPVLDTQPQELLPDEQYKTHPNAMPQTDGLDGIQLVGVSGSTFQGYMLVISDPSRVHLAVSYSIMVSYQNGWDNTYGEQLRSMAKRNNAVAAINGGAFYDLDGQGNGGRPDGALCIDGKLIYWGPEVEAQEAYDKACAEIDEGLANGTIAEGSPEAQYPELANTEEVKVNIIAINYDGILVLGRFTKAEFEQQNLRDAVSFDNPNPPFLVINGKASTVVGTGGSGIQPRTCIAQRADGAFLFLVIDGRGAGGSLGATQKEAMDLLIEFGAVNAANLDGGSSSEMIIDGETISNPCSLYGPRYMPTGFYVAR